jgi:hypothetical protein
MKLRSSVVVELTVEIEVDHDLLSTEEFENFSETDWDTVNDLIMSQLDKEYGNDISYNARPVETISI